MARVLMILTNPYRPDPRVQREARWLSSGGHQVTIVCWDRAGTYPKEEADGPISLIRVGPRSTWGDALTMVRHLPLFWRQVRKAVTGHGFDIIHAHDLDTLPCAIILASLKGIPLVYDAHEDYAAMVSPTVGWPIASLIAFGESMLVPLADAVVTVSPPYGHRYRTMGAALVALVMGCPDRGEAPDDERAAGLRAGLQSGNRTVLVYIGVLEPDRFLMELVREVRQHPDDLYLVLGGYGSLEADLRAAADPASSRFLGRIPPEEVLTWSRAGDVVAAVYDPDNGNNRRSLPNKLFEAALVGRPLLAARRSAAARLSARHGFGIPIDYRHPGSLVHVLKGAIGDRDDRARLQAAAERAGITAFNGEQMGDKLRRLYRKVLGTGKG